MNLQVNARVAFKPLGDKKKVPKCNPLKPHEAV